MSARHEAVKRESSIESVPDWWARVTPIALRASGDSGQGGQAVEPAPDRPAWPRIRAAVGIEHPVTEPESSPPPQPRGEGSNRRAHRAGTDVHGRRARGLLSGGARRGAA